MIKITHNYGFFSCCSMRLNHIVAFINSHKKLPNHVDSSQQFIWYKKNINEDVTYDYFENYNNIKTLKIPLSINFNHTYQFINYSKLDYKNITPLVKKYFSPSDKINKTINNLEKKYNFIYDNTLAVYYRGTDKDQEMGTLSSTIFDEYYKQITEIINKNKNIRILIQTDTAQFIDYINSKNMKNILIIDENEYVYSNKGIHKCPKTSTSNYYHMLNFLSIILIMSKCKYIICNSGNCSLWIMLYRGNGKNIIQNAYRNWYNSIF